MYEKRTLNAKKVRKILDSNTVFILNINRYRFFKQIFRSTKWARVVVDEMDSANIPSIFDEFGNFNWFLTATPTSIFYKSCRRYVNKIFGYNQHLLNYFIIKNKDEYVDQSIVLPKPHVYLINTMLQRTVAAIKDLIPQDVLQLINAGNMKEAINKLNCDVDTEENIVKVLTDKINTELFNLEKELEYVNGLIPVDQDAHDKRVKKIEEDIARCKTKIETVNERIASVKEDCCFICADAFDTPTILDCCKSVFCLKCLLAALKMANNKCPYCRHVLESGKEYHVISSKPKKTAKAVVKKESIDPFKNMDKTKVLEKLLQYIAKNDDTPRILIFSDYSQTFDKIVKNIEKAKLQYALISGVPSHITNVINEFNAGTTNILMLDSQHYGSGLNLQAANYLILFHRMTKEMETQVIGRAQRFGRKTELKIIYLVNDSENKLVPIVKRPIELAEEDELWMLTNPADRSDNEEENDSDEESNEESEKEEPVKTKKNTNKIAKKKKKVIESEEESENESNEGSENESNEESENESNDESLEESENESDNESNGESNEESTESEPETKPKTKSKKKGKIAKIESDSEKSEEAEIKPKKKKKIIKSDTKPKKKSVKKPIKKLITKPTKKKVVDV
jgi:hypothetical protein